MSLFESEVKKNTQTFHIFMVLNGKLSYDFNKHFLGVRTLISLCPYLCLYVPKSNCQLWPTGKSYCLISIKKKTVFICGFRDSKSRRAFFLQRLRQISITVVHVNYFKLALKQIKNNKKYNLCIG